MNGMDATALPREEKRTFCISVSSALQKMIGGSDKYENGRLWDLRGLALGAVSDAGEDDVGAPETRQALDGERGLAP